MSSSTLKVHMEIHKDEKPYACSHCDATFKSSLALKRHTGIHTGNKTSFSCLKCEKNLLGHGALKSHMMLHTGEKPRACSYCPYQSVQAVSLQCHIQNNHIREKTFHCTICGDYFLKKIIWKSTTPWPMKMREYRAKSVTKPFWMYLN